MKNDLHFVGAGNEYINALTKLHSASCDTPITATANLHRCPSYGRKLLSQRPCPMSAVLNPDGVQGDTDLINNGAPRDGES